MNTPEQRNRARECMLSYHHLDEKSREVSCLADWVALKMRISKGQALSLIGEVNAQAEEDAKSVQKVDVEPLSKRELMMCDQGLGLWRSDYPISGSTSREIDALREKLSKMIKVAK